VPRLIAGRARRDRLRAARRAVRGDPARPVRTARADQSRGLGCGAVRVLHRDAAREGRRIRKRGGPKPLLAVAPWRRSVGAAEGSDVACAALEPAQAGGLRDKLPSQIACGFDG
jgi:hypothetical protein